MFTQFKLKTRLPDDVREQLNAALALSKAEGREVRLTYCPCGQGALTNLLPGEKAYCSNCTARLTPGAARTRWKWDRWIGNGKTLEPTMWVKRVLEFRGRLIAIHKFVAPDAPSCFHTHDALCFRLILKGGYEEEIKHWENAAGDGYFYQRVPWTAFNAGFVQPALRHRIHRLFRTPTYTLWIRLKKTAEIQIEGEC